MKAALALLPTGVLLILVGTLWSWRGEHPTVSLTHRAMRRSQLGRDPPTADSGNLYNITAPGLSAWTIQKHRLSSRTSRIINRHEHGSAGNFRRHGRIARIQYNKTDRGPSTQASAIQTLSSDLSRIQYNDTQHGLSTGTSHDTSSLNTRIQYNNTAHGLLVGNTRIQNISTARTDGFALTNNSRIIGPMEQGIFWSQILEQALPKGFPEEDALRWQESARSAYIVSLERGCGRSTNRVATLSDGSRVCVRYGINPEQIQGEALSYYLSRLLGLRGVPPCVLSKVGSPQWGPVQSELGTTGWTQGALLSLTPWVHNLSIVLPPRALSAEGGQLRTLHEELERDTTRIEEMVNHPNQEDKTLKHSTLVVKLAKDHTQTGDMAKHPAQGRVMGTDNQYVHSGELEVAQWADLIVFDYLTANFDRMVSNLFSLQWDPRIMLRGTNNLHRAPDGTLVLLDNEAGMAHGYRLRDTWDKYNEQLLSAVCLFRRGAAWKLRELHMAQSATRELHTLYQNLEPMAAELGLLTEAQGHVLQDRVARVYRHVLNCQDKYS